MSGDNDVSKYKDKNFGVSLLVPVMVTFLFTIPHWMKIEETWKRRFCTLPLLIGQFWPQWQFIKVLWLMGQNNLGWKIEKERLEKDIGSLGKSITTKYRISLIDILP